MPLCTICGRYSVRLIPCGACGASVCSACLDPVSGYCRLCRGVRRVS